jgi:hypothetical protein
MDGTGSGSNPMMDCGLAALNGATVLLLLVSRVQMSGNYKFAEHLTSY